MPNTLLRHIAACHNAVLPGGRAPIFLGPHQIGWAAPGTAAWLAGHGARDMGRGLQLESPAMLTRLANEMVQDGLIRRRGEAFDVRADPDGPVLAQLDRGALPLFGVRARGVHMNGLVRRGEQVWLWVARRAADKLLDPGKLDHIVAGGVPAGLTPGQTLIKEAQEEAALPPALLRTAQHVATLAYAMDRPEGLRRDLLFCYDLWLPDGVLPQPDDGEVEAFELWPLTEVATAVRRTEMFKFNVNLVLIDLFLRAGLIEPSGAEARSLRAALGRAEFECAA